ncbi:MAG: hypothetical protein ACFE95_11030 [Candidatus Hodarchaeota archaeon]
MKFTLFDIGLSIFVIGFLIIDYSYQLTKVVNGLDIIILLGIFLIFLIWASILIYNLSSVSIDFAYPDETQVTSGLRRKRLIRTIILAVGVCTLLIGTFTFVEFLLALVFSINVVALRVAFLLLGPEENPYVVIVAPMLKRE